MGEIRAALFDIDGTLIDSNALHVIAWTEAFAGVGRPVEPRAVAGLIGMGGDTLVPTLLPEADAALRADIAARHDTIFKGRYLAQARPFPAARDLVMRAHDAGLKAVLASSASAAEVEHYVALMDIGRFLAASTSIDEVARSKPAPDIFATALAKAGVPAAAALAIGDSPFDVESAAKSGVRTIGLLSGGFDRTALTGAVAIYADAADLLAGYDRSPLAG